MWLIFDEAHVMPKKRKIDKSCSWHHYDSLLSSKENLLEIYESKRRFDEKEINKPECLESAYIQAVDVNEKTLSAIYGNGRDLYSAVHLSDDYGGERMADSLNGIYGAACILKRLGFDKLSATLIDNTLHYLHLIIMENLEETVLRAKRATLNSRRTEEIRERAKKIWLEDETKPLSLVSEMLAKEFPVCWDAVREKIADLNPRKGKRGRPKKTQ
jgi:hypothetical protein